MKTQAGCRMSSLKTQLNAVRRRNACKVLGIQSTKGVRRCVLGLWGSALFYYRFLHTIQFIIGLYGAVRKSEKLMPPEYKAPPESEAETALSDGNDSLRFHSVKLSVKSISLSLYQNPLALTVTVYSPLSSPSIRQVSFFGIS